MSKLPDGCAVRIDDMAERMEFIRQIKAAGASMTSITADGTYPIFMLWAAGLSGDSIENCAKNSRPMVTKEQMLAHFCIGVHQTDDVIRVGDTVEVIDKSGHSRAVVGHMDIVIRVGVNGNPSLIEISNGVRMFAERFKKIKAGGPASTKQTTTQHGQVSGKSDKGQGGGGGRAVRSDGRRASVATGQRYPGHPKGAHIGEAQSEHAEVRRAVVRGGHH